VLRCNPGDRSQAFCTVPGLPHDVFVRGGVAQNRSVEGDEVAIRLLPLHEWHRHDKNARAPAVAGAAPRGNVAAFGGAGRREMQRRMTPPVWSQTVPGTPGNDLIASPALYPSPSGGELAFALDAAAACDDEAGADADEAGASAAAAEVQRMELGGGSDTNHSMLSFLESTFRSPAAPRPSPAAPPPQPPQPAAPWAGAGDAKAAAAAVAALLQADWMGFRATAEVVAVLAPSPRRHNIVGVLLPAGGGGLLLDPCNPRMPQLRVPDRALPTPHAAQLLAESRRANAPRRTLVAASLVRWEPGEALPEGAVTEVVGEAGGLEAETRALLMQERVNDDDAFTPDVLACLPAAPWAVDEAEAARRRDFRRARVFSIDPPTARDLDDALSVEDLGGGGPGGERLLRIGVHIADVSHFVRRDNGRRLASRRRPWCCAARALHSDTVTLWPCGARAPLLRPSASA
jgi:exoribonuclease R